MILTCPFCNKLPAIDKRRGGRGYWLIHCKNVECKVVVETSDYDRDAALLKWNGRVIP